MRIKERDENQNRKRRAGFTLVEMLVVITIIGILAAVAVQNVIQHVATTRIAATRASIKTVDDAIQIYRMKYNDKLPETLEELTQKGRDGEDSLLREGSTVDAWGTPFNYSRQGRSYTITSAGPDGDFGTADDLTN